MRNVTSYEPPPPICVMIRGDRVCITMVVGGINMRGRLTRAVVEEALIREVVI